MKKILIIGAGFLQSFVIEKAKKMGYETLAVDGNPLAIGFKNADKYKVIDITDKEECLKYALEEKINGVLTAATDYGVLTAAYISEKMSLPGIPYHVAQLVKNKYLVRKCLYENNVDDTEQCYEVLPETNLAELTKKINYPVMVKPCDGSGSRGASRVDNEKDLEKACLYAMDASVSHRAEVESFINGKEYGAESLVVDGNIYVLAIMKKWMTSPPYYAELGHAIPCGLSKAIEKKAIKCVEKAIKALGITFGSVNMDMIITSEGKVHIIDIGARMGGNLIGSCIIPYGTGIDYMGNMIKNAVGDKVDYKISSHEAVVSKLLAFNDGIVKKLPNILKLSNDYKVEIYHNINIGDKVNKYHTNLDGLGYIIAKGKNIEDAEQRAAKVLKEIEMEIF